jgi:hypothetical protein
MGRGSCPPDALMFLASLLPRYLALLRYLAPSALLAFLPRWYLLSFTFLPQRGLSAGTCFRLLLSLGATCPRIAVPPRPSIAFLPRHHSFSSTSSRGATCPSIAFLLRRHLFSYASLPWRCLSLGPPVALPVPRLPFSYGATCFPMLPSRGAACPSIAFLLRRHLFSYASLPWRCLSLGPPVALPVPRLPFSYGATCFPMLPSMLPSRGVACPSIAFLPRRHLFSYTSLPWRYLSLDCLFLTAPLVFLCFPPCFPPVALPVPRLPFSHGATCFRILPSRGAA